MKLDLEQARQFLKALHGDYFSKNKGHFIEVRHKAEGGDMQTAFYTTPDALLKAMSAWNRTHNYWPGVAPRSNNRSGTKEDVAAMPAIYADIDWGTEGHAKPSPYQTKEEAQAAVEQCPFKSSILVDTGGGLQPYWKLKEPIRPENGNLERFERVLKGFAKALKGDPLNAATILRLPGTSNMKLADNPRPVKMIHCHPERTYTLDELEQWAKPFMEQEQAPRGGNGQGSRLSGHEAYAQAALTAELTKLARSPHQGQGRNIQLNQSSFALGQLIGGGVLDRGSVEAALYGTALSIGLNEKETRATIKSGIEAGVKEPRELPEKKANSAKRTQEKTVPPLIKKLDIASIYAQETGLKLLTDPPQVDKDGFTPCSVLYCPDDPSHTAFINVGPGERRGYYIEMKDGKTWGGGNLCKTIAEKGSGPYPTPKAVYAYLKKTAGAKGGAAAAGEQTLKSPKIDTTKPIIPITNRYLDSISNDAIKALETANHPPFMFIRSGSLVRVSLDEKDTPKIVTLNDIQLRGILARHAFFLKDTDKGPAATSPPMDAVKDILHLGEWPFPALEGLVQSPVLRPDGTILIEPGYDPSTRLYYINPPDLFLPPIPENPTAQEIQEALGYLTEIICDFPFVEDADRANALGLIFTLPLRPAIPGNVPMAAITCPTPGTGKGLLTDAVALLGTGKGAPMAGFPRDDDEMRKAITARLLAGDQLIAFDNIEMPLWGPSLSRALTCNTWEDRILGQSATVRLPQRAVWIANGNNLKLRGDYPRRTFPIRLDAKVAKPWERDNFRHDNLKEWVSQRRGDFMAAILSIARAWFVAGKPEPKNPLPVLGGFEDWSKTIGGILSFAGVRGFLENLKQFHDEADLEGPEWEAFLNAWVEVVGESAKSCQEVAAILRDNSGFAATLPDNLQDVFKDPDKSFERSLGRALARKENRPYGEKNLAIQRVKTTRDKVILWKVAPL